MSSQKVDLFEIFQIYNPRFRYNSCVGYAPTKGKRCGWDMSDSSVAEKLKVIEKNLQRVQPTDAELIEVATLALCHHHKRQARAVVIKWKSLLEDLDLEDLYERMRNTRMDDDDSSPRFGANQSTREEAKREQAERERKERFQEEQRKKREERAKENARKEQQRKDREAEGERRSWRQAWTRYAEAQQKFIGKNVQSSSGIPWPVRTGMCKDVNEQNVIAFYRNALPGSTVHETYKSMQRECLIWHPDKSKQFVVGITLTAVEEASMAVIARMVIVMHKEYKERRAS